MANTTTPLSDIKVKTTKPQEKEYALFDGGGLVLRVRPNGSKSWRFTYTKPFTKKRSNVSFGTYPEVSLAAARILRQDARELIAQEIDPKDHREEQKRDSLEALNNTFRLIAQNWFNVYKTKISQKTARDAWNGLENYIFPELGNTPINKLTASATIDVLKPLANAGRLESVKKLCQRINNILTFAVNTGVIESNRLAGISKAFEAPTVTSVPALKPHELPELMKALTKSQVTYQTRCLIEWQLHTMVRPREAAGARWEEIDLDNKTWTIPDWRMKKKHTHIVPLSDETIALLEVIKKTSSKSEFLFPSKVSKSGHVSNETANKGLIRMGFKGRLCAHGLRTIASTTLNEQGHDFDVIEMALAHIAQGVRATYNRTTYLERRRILMAYWSQHITQAATGNMSLATSGNKLSVVNG
ncbi:integrase domain-containing protein [Thalassotalea psychrophila]|uniref:Integrase domain-containing protein n=1 Tax=Thalassotalea psychrophila TaxID=3065647 RepID=A0ABY9TUK8_9GAMM|nr:integrase domain-containing protein [Colwelliaceae bacterium SQ149]